MSGKSRLTAVSEAMTLRGSMESGVADDEKASQASEGAGTAAIDRAMSDRTRSRKVLATFRRNAAIGPAVAVLSKWVTNSRRCICYPFSFSTLGNQNGNLQLANGA